MSKALNDWSRDELETFATCLRDDLRTAGPRFSIEFTPVPPDVRVITSVPPSDAPPAAADPGSGGFIERGGLFVEDWDRLDSLPEAVKRLMGSMHAALGEPADTAIALRVDGFENMSLVFWSGLDHLEHLAELVDQVQDVVMETTHERWPKCPAHDHELLPRLRGEWVEWQCPDTGEAIARFGELTGRLP
jgi:hypothetical protein